MDDRITAILATLRERFAADASREAVEAFLSSEGYDRREIGEIVAVWFADIPGAPSGDRERSTLPAQSTMAFRVLGPHERGRFSTEAWGHLLALSGAGVLSAPELEHVIERSLAQVDGQIALDELRALLESFGLSSSADAGGGGGKGTGGSGADHVTIH